MSNRYIKYIKDDHEFLAVIIASDKHSFEGLAAKTVPAGVSWVEIPEAEALAPRSESNPAEILAAERAAMSATRGQFLIAAVGAGIITEATAEEAAGGGWPAAFDTFMAGLSAPQRIAAKAAWVDGDKVRRTNLILALIAADQSVSPEAVDDLFRAAMAIEL